MIYDIPIEPIEKRYSVDWRDWFQMEYNKYGIPFTTIIGQALTDKIENGRFLDVCGTNHYKASQLMEITKLFYENRVKDNDVFFFHDLWFPGLEMLAYIRDAMKINFKITGCFHAGCWDKEDFLYQSGMNGWAGPLENSWFRIVDSAFVATGFHKDMIVNGRFVNKDKIKVTGFPLYKKPEYELEFHGLTKKKNMVVFPHRLDPEKNPRKFDVIKKSDFPGYSFVKTMANYTTKTDYYKTLCESKIAVSFADQETWGIAMQEAVLCGCLPLVPDRLSYSELYKRRFKYIHMNDFTEKLKSFIKRWSKIDKGLDEQKNSILRKGENAIPSMFKELNLI